MAYTRTHRYLYPGVALNYDAGFIRFLVDLDPSIINSFIGDMDYDKQVNACLFLLVRKNKLFEHVQKFFQTHKSYQDDYHSGKPDSDLHMFVLKVPSEKSYNWFILSRYSKMYDKKFLETNFKRADGSYTESYHIMMKTPQKWLELKNKYNFSDSVDPDEYDGCIKMDEEVYNFQITNV